VGAHLTAVETGDLALVDTRDRLGHQAASCIERYHGQARTWLALEDPRIAQLDLAYHDINRRPAACSTCSSAGAWSRG
jgi:proteasome accessory factor A